MLNDRSIDRLIRTFYNFQSSKELARPYEWYVSPRNNKLYAVHYSSTNGKLHHIRLTGEYRISFKGNITPIIECWYPHCKYVDKIKLRGHRTFMRQCRKKRKHDTLALAMACDQFDPHEGMYLCLWCGGYHLTRTKYNPK